MLYYTQRRQQPYTLVILKQVQDDGLRNEQRFFCCYGGSLLTIYSFFLFSFFIKVYLKQIYSNNIIAVHNVSNSTITQYKPIYVNLLTSEKLLTSVVQFC